MGGGGQKGDLGPKDPCLSGVLMFPEKGQTSECAEVGAISGTHNLKTIPRGVLGRCIKELPTSVPAPRQTPEIGATKEPSFSRGQATSQRVSQKEALGGQSCLLQAPWMEESGAPPRDRGSSGEA